MLQALRVLCLSLLLLPSGLCAVTEETDADIWEGDPVADFFDLADPMDFNPTASVETFTTGFLRAEFIVSQTSPKTFVQAVALAIGVCYQSDSSPDEYTKLTKIVVDKNVNEITLFFSTFSDDTCTTETSSSTEIQPFKSKVTTVDNVVLKVKWKYTSSFSAATRLWPSNSVGFIVSFYGEDNTCSGDAFKYLVGTNRCAPYPDFFGHVQCKENGQKLIFTEYTFNSQFQCNSGATRLKTQPFACSNQGSAEEPSYQEAACLPPP